MSPLIVPKPPPSGGIPRYGPSQSPKTSTYWKNPPAHASHNIPILPVTGKILPQTARATTQARVFLPPTGGITPQTARAPSQPPTQMMPRSASGPCQSGYSPSRADAINCSGSRFAGSVFGLNGNFSARIFSYVTISSSYCNVRSISS